MLDVSRFGSVDAVAAQPRADRSTAAPAARGSAAPGGSSGRSSTAMWRRPGTWLALVAVLHAVSPLVLLGAHWWFGIDETVYLSQLNAHVPAGGFSAPRARGTTFVAAPVTLVTSSIAAVRLWVATLSGLALYAAFRPWLALRPGYVVPVAAGLFSSVWMVIYYGFEVMPNEWVAFGTLGACGCLLRFLADGRALRLGCVAAALAVVALFRPSDAVYAGIALAVCCVASRSTSRRRTLVAIGGIGVGVALGAAEWVIEAYLRFGGLGARIRGAQAEQGGAGVHFAGAAQARALAGPLLCRGTCHASAGIGYQLWWIALGVLLVVAVARLGRRGAPMLDLAPLFVGLVLAGQYVFTVTYAAPRFLIPAYALLSLPAAAGLGHVVRAVRRGLRRGAAVGLIVLATAAHLTIQVHVITAHIAPPSRRVARTVSAQVAYLRTAGLRPPCVITGRGVTDQNLAYAAGCLNTWHVGTVPAQLRASRHVLWLGARPPAQAGTRWRALHLPGPIPTSTVAYVSVPAN